MSMDWQSDETSRAGRPGTIGARSVALFLLGLVLFNPPLMTVFAVEGLVLGVPLLYLYLFVAWGVLIALVRLAARRNAGAAPPGLLDEGE